MSFRKSPCLLSRFILAVSNGWSSFLSQPHRCLRSKHCIAASTCHGIYCWSLCYTMLYPYVFAALSPCKSLLAAGLFNLPFLQRAGHMHGTTKAWNHGKRVWEDIWSAMEIRARFVQQAMKSVSTYDIHVDLEVHIIFNISYPTARGDNPHPPQRSIKSVFEFYREGVNRLNVVAPPHPTPPTPPSQHGSHVASSNSHNQQRKKLA